MSDTKIETESIRRSGDTVDQVVQAVRADIIAGRYRPGQRLVARSLTGAMQLSRSTVREALRRLAADGMITLVPNRGAAVRQLSRAEMHDLFQLRELLEGLGARLCAERIDAEGRRAAFAAIWQEVKGARADSFLVDNHRFHAAITAGAANTHLAGLLERMQLPILMIQVRRQMGLELLEKSIADHIVIADAILAGDGPAAEAAMQAHLRRSREWVLALPDEAFATG
ncbi:MAG: GntR family transcriptional regulator [Alphaproteobacteria bacterium]|nr:GntR family transcriptional regulator [Alphaproteobacteria bacterium]